MGKELEIPRIGLGTFDLKESHISEALKMGYQLVDTAWQYGNEKEVGNALKNSNISRENIFVTTKLWTESVRSGNVEQELKQSLDNLGLEYIDMYLIHWPAEGFEKAWELMLKLKEKGFIRNVGVSNFQIHHLERLTHISDEIPVVNQIECHPYFQNKEVVQYCKDKKIIAQAWCPLGGSYARFFEKDIFKKLAKKYDKSSAQIILRWHIQRGVYVIPRSANVERLRQNLNIMDFELCQEDMEMIDKLDTGKRIGADPDNFRF